MRQPPGEVATVMSKMPARYHSAVPPFETALDRVRVLVRSTSEIPAPGFFVD